MPEKIKSLFLKPEPQQRLPHVRLYTRRLLQKNKNNHSGYFHNSTYKSEQQQIKSMITKNQVAAKCIYIMQRQLRDTNHPVMRRRIQEHIDRLSTFGMMEIYSMLVYNDSITLLCNDYEEEPNYTLYNSNAVRIGKFDSCLRLHDNTAVRINGNGTADTGKAVHGRMTGECITQTLKYKNGKEIKFGYNETSPAPSEAKGRVVKNDPNRNIIMRILRNETIGRKEFLVGILLVLAVAYAISGLAFAAGTISKGQAPSVAALGIYIVPLIMYIMLIYKRVGDFGPTGLKRVAIMFLLMCINMLGFIILLLMPTKVATAEERRNTSQADRQAAERAKATLSKRSNTFSGTLPWFGITPEILAIANRIENRMPAGASRPNNGSDADSSGVNSEYPQDNNCNMEEPECRESDNKQAEQEEEERESRRKEIESKIDALKRDKSSYEDKKRGAENDANSQRQQGDTYASYANSESDEGRRNDYMQNAESCYSKANEYESLAREYESKANECENDIRSLEGQL